MPLVEGVSRSIRAAACRALGHEEEPALCPLTDGDLMAQLTRRLLDEQAEVEDLLGRLR